MQEVYCKGCKYLKEGDGFIRYSHVSNLVTKPDAYEAIKFNPTIESVNQDNKCKLRQDK